MNGYLEGKACQMKEKNTSKLEFCHRNPGEISTGLQSDESLHYRRGRQKVWEPFEA